jgi:hypothetical protein
MRAPLDVSIYVRDFQLERMLGGHFAALIDWLGFDFECGLPSRGLTTLGVLRRGDDGGEPLDPLGMRTGHLEIQICSGPPLGCGWVHLFLELIAHGSPWYSRKTGFLEIEESWNFSSSVVDQPSDLPPYNLGDRSSCWLVVGGKGGVS